MKLVTYSLMVVSLVGLLGLRSCDKKIIHDEEVLIEDVFVKPDAQAK